MRKLALVLVVLALAVPGATAGGAQQVHKASKTYTVKVGDDFFSPTRRTIHVRDIVKWVWVGEDGKPGTTINEHTVTDSKDRFGSEEMRSGTYRHRFKKAGKYRIFCAVHPDTMVMKITVKSS